MFHASQKCWCRNALGIGPTYNSAPWSSGCLLFEVKIRSSLCVVRRRVVYKSPHSALLEVQSVRVALVEDSLGESSRRELSMNCRFANSDRCFRIPGAWRRLIFKVSFSRVVGSSDERWMLLVEALVPITSQQLVQRSDTFDITMQLYKFHLWSPEKRRAAFNQKTCIWRRENYNRL